MSQLTIDQAMQIAAGHHQAGRLAEAEGIYRQILAQFPDHPDALCNFGAVLRSQGKHQEAIVPLRRAIELRPGFAEAYFDLGQTLRAMRELDQAEAAFGHAIVLRPDFAEAHNNLGGVLQDKSQLKEAIVEYRTAVSLRPDSQVMRYNLGSALLIDEQYDQAIDAFREAIAGKPDWALLHNSLGTALRAIGELDQALIAFGRAIELSPESAEAHNNRASVLQDQGQIEQAIAGYRNAIALQPDKAAFHMNLGMLLLLSENFDEGWIEYEHRHDDELRDPAIRIEKPLWLGEPLNGRSILIYYEQGLGDTIHFCRYLNLLAQRGAGRIIFQSQPELAGLLDGLQQVQIVPRGQPLPEFDVYCPLLSLPMRFKTNLQTISGIATVPYLHADPERARLWQSRISDANQTGPKVGVAWAGHKNNRNDRNRSIPLRVFKELLAANPDVMWISLQKDAAAQQMSDLPPQLHLHDWTSELHDFADTAALIANLDLVITVDTAVAHLAAAMGKPVWVLLPFAPDWRWMLSRDDSPWYPTMRLLRQPRPRDWEPVIRQAAGMLGEMGGGCEKDEG